MKKSLIIFILYSILLPLTGQGYNDIKDGYTILKYPNGSISSEGIIRNGNPDGFWKSYYITGVKKSEGKRTNFLLDSIWVFFDQSGDTIEKISYLYGKKNGYYLKYKTDPSAGNYIWSKELFAGDKKEGTAYIYFPDGNVQQTITYYSGKKEGISRELDRNGNVISVLEYNNDNLITRERINRKDNAGMKQGTWKEFYPRGNIKSEATYKDDMLNGYYKEYDQYGKLTLTMLYDNGAIVKSNVEDEPDIEIVNKYNDNNKLIYSGPFRNKVPVGVHRDYDENGKIIYSHIYNDVGVLISEGIVDEAGNYNGKWKDFYPDGKVKSEGQYTDSRRTGIWRFYNQASKLEQSGNFNNGRPDGLWTWYYASGVVLREEEYFQGRRDGASTEFAEDGSVIAKGDYSDDEKNGEWKFTSGDYTEEGKYILGLKDGTWKAFYSDGTLKHKGNYIQGNPEGTHQYFYENGTLKEEQNYRMGLRHKTWKKFNEEGLPVLTINYKDDVEISINGVKINLPQSDTKLIK